MLLYDAFRPWRFGLLALLALVITACGQNPPTPSPQTQTTLLMSAPATINAGDSIAITIGPAPVRDGTPVGLIMVGTYGPRAYHSQFAAGMAEFIIPAEHTRQPGYLAFIAAADNARGEISVQLAPGGIRMTSARASYPRAAYLPRSY